MELMEGLLTRRSVRKYQDKKIEKSVLDEILAAAQYAPSAHNKQPWEFLVVEDKEVMANLRQIQPWTSFAKDAACVVIVCGRTDEAFSRNKDGETWSYVDIDCSLATQNLLLAAWAKGIGACFCGCAPMSRIMDAIKDLFNLPDNVRPFAIVPLGYPAETPAQPEGRAQENKIHWDKW